MADYAELITRLKQSDDNCNAECCECSGECLSSGCNIFSEAADAIEELLAELVTIRNQLPRWVSVEERMPERTNPFHARDVFLVRLRSGCIKTLFYEYDNSDRCTPGMVPLFDEGWAKTVVPVTHWMPLPAPPTEKGVE